MLVIAWLTMGLRYPVVRSSGTIIRSDPRQVLDPAFSLEKLEQ